MPPSQSLDLTGRAFICAMYTPRRLRYATRWNRRLVFVLALMVLLFVSWRSYRAWQRPHLPVPAPPSRLV